MSEPIPLRDPEGRLVTYACGVCRKQAGHNERQYNEPATSPGYGYWLAKTCCECAYCRTTLGATTPAYKTCAACHTWHRWRALWQQLGTHILKEYLRATPGLALAVRDAASELLEDDE